MRRCKIGEGKRHLGGFGLGPAADELVTDALDWLADVQLGAIEVDVSPSKPEQFPFAQAQHQDQDAGRVKRVIVAAGGLKEPTRFIDCP